MVIKIDFGYNFNFQNNFISFASAGLTQPAPVELPQGRKAARVDG